KFRMEPFKKLITVYVGLAIDEFKREEDHQTFLNTIREYVKNRGKSHSTIHVLQGDTFTFFRNNGNHIPKRELRHIIQNEPLYLRSEEHTSELQSRFDLVCRLLLEKKNTIKT